MSSPRVELLWWDGCPSWPRALDKLREALAELGLDPECVEMREIDTEQMAQGEHFFGSPTIRVDGEELSPPAEGEAFGLTCRVYRLRDGRISPTPDAEDLRELLSRAMARRSAA